MNVSALPTGEPLPLDLVNTRPLSGGSRADLLGTPDRLAAWLARQRDRLGGETDRLAGETVGPAPSEADLAPVHAVRAHTEAALRALLDGRRPPESALRGLADAQRAAPAVLVPVWDGTAVTAPPRRTGPLHATPDAILRKMSGVPLGMARAAIDHVRELARTRVDRESGTPWAESARVRSTLARAEMELAAARAAVYTSLEEQWAALERGDETTARQRTATALARYHAFRTGRSIVSTLFDLVGGSSIYRGSSPLDRWLRDANTMCQHAVAQDSILELTGQVLLGGESRSPFF